jgi:hypothetical protein
MNRGMLVLLISASVVSSVRLSANGPATIESIDSGVSSTSAQSTPLTSTTVSVRGTIARYDPSSRLLSLATANGTVQLTVASAARIRHGSQEVDPLTLQTLAGYQATLRYQESGDSKTVESVHVFGKNDRQR